MKMDHRPLASFCDHRGARTQVPIRIKAAYFRALLISDMEFTNSHGNGPNHNIIFESEVKVEPVCLIPGDFRGPGSLPVKKSRSLAGGQRLQGNDRKNEQLQRLFWLPNARPLAPPLTS